MNVLLHVSCLIPYLSHNSFFTKEFEKTEFTELVSCIYYMQAFDFCYETCYIRYYWYAQT